MSNKNSTKVHYFFPHPGNERLMEEISNREDPYGYIKWDWVIVLTLHWGETPVCIICLLSGILNQCRHYLFPCKVNHKYRTKRHSNISFPWIIKLTNMKYNIPQPWICLSFAKNSLQWFSTCRIDYKTNKQDESIMVNWLFISVINESDNI